MAASDNLAATCPCPYCGGTATVVSPVTWFGSLSLPGKATRAYMAHCPGCRATGPWKDSELEALEAWMIPSGHESGPW